ncbi:hypothetical protein DSECCO2_395760 [anaerobic digester metagenome]
MPASFPPSWKLKGGYSSVRKISLSSAGGTAVVRVAFGVWAPSVDGGVVVQPATSMAATSSMATDNQVMGRIALSNQELPLSK